MTVTQDPATYLQAATAELRDLVGGAGASDEALLQSWLEQHPAFVPGAHGQDGSSGMTPWPGALITQPPLPGIVGHVPDFLWLAADSRGVTAVLVEIERPNKRWFTVDGDPYQGHIGQARSQITNWRAWFSNPTNQLKFLDDYLVPDELRRLEFRQHYVLVLGRRAEFDNQPEWARRRAVAGAGDNEMTWDRLIEGPNVKAVTLGCVRVSATGGGYDAVSVPPLWDPSRIDERALSRTGGLREAVAVAPMADERKQACVDYLDTISPPPPPGPRFRPPQRR
ncbi:Shedu anti-phage system protein SduA domain-containing protein [Micromonospora sediminicola]|uniref:Shedu anti-phage system protein SduA domain-containing protein n=1 Tax=Micromonospora sediminicola TaxID=946078 RepID=UPI0033FF5FFB